MRKRSDRAQVHSLCSQYVPKPSQSQTIAVEYPFYTETALICHHSASNCDLFLLVTGKLPFL